MCNSGLVCSRTSKGGLFLANGPKSPLHCVVPAGPTKCRSN